MPRAAEYQQRRARHLCVECPTPTHAARCPICKARERARAKGRSLSAEAQRRGDRRGIGGFRWTDDPLVVTCEGCGKRFEPAPSNATERCLSCRLKAT